MPGVMEFLALIALLQAESSGKSAAAAKPGPPGPPGPPAPYPATTPAAAAAPAAAAPPAAAPAASAATAAAAAKKNGKPAAPAATPATAAAVATAAAKPGGAVPMPPWPTAAVPATLPAFPGAGWVPDTPETSAVSARAAYWNQYLWDQPNKKIVRPFVQENFGGQWLTFAAQWHPGDKGPQTFMATEAWRVATAPSATPPTVALTPVQHAAQLMNAALAAHGYKAADQELYRNYQAAAGLPRDGFPGTGTMTSLRTTLATMGTSLAPVKIYPWRSTGAYDGVNAPTQAEWGAPAAAVVHPAAAAAHAVATQAAATPPAATVLPGAMPAAVSPYPGPGAWQTNKAYIIRYQTALQWLSQITGNTAYNPVGIDGVCGNDTKAAVKAFQADAGLTQDGECGADTAAAIDAAVMSHAPGAATTTSGVGVGQVTFDPREREHVQAWIAQAVPFLHEYGYEVRPPPTA